MAIRYSAPEIGKKGPKYHSCVPFAGWRHIELSVKMVASVILENTMKDVRDAFRAFLGRA